MFCCFCSLSLLNRSTALCESSARRADRQASPSIEFLHGPMFLHDIYWCENSSMLTVQVCQQHRLAAMNPNKAKSFPAAIVPAVAKLGHHRRGKRETLSEERRNARRTRASKRQCRRWRSRGVVGLPHPTRRKKEGTNLGRKHLEELSERRRVFARKSDGGSGRRGSPSARNTRPPGRGLGWRSSRSARSTFAQKRLTASTVSGISTPCSEPVLQRVVTSSDCRRPKGAELPKFLHLNTAFVLVVIAAGLREGKGGMGLDSRSRRISFKRLVRTVSQSSASAFVS